MSKKEDGSWRDPQPLDEVDAINARRALAMCTFYPTSDLDEDPGTVLLGEILRARLHQIVDELTCTDLVGVYKLARVVMLVPREPGIFERIKRQSARVLKRMGYPVQVGEVERVGA